MSDSPFTPEQQEWLAKNAAKYAKADSWWQTYRREHPLATQNILGFGGLLVGIALGIPLGMYLK